MAVTGGREVREHTGAWNVSTPNPILLINQRYEPNTAMPTPCGPWA